MTCRLHALCFDANHPIRLARFWAGVLGWDQNQETAIRAPHGGPKVTWGGPPLRPKTGRNRLRFELAPPAGGDQRAEVDRLVSLGATCIDAGRRGGAGQSGAGRVDMADPDGNEFSVRMP